MINFYSELLNNLKNSDNTSWFGNLIIDNIAIDNYILEQEKYHHLLYDYFKLTDDIKNRERKNELSASIKIQEKKLKKKIKKYKEDLNE